LATGRGVARNQSHGVGVESTKRASLFLTVEVDMAVVPSVRPRSVSLSLAVHAAALVALFVLSALGPEPLPSPVVVASSPRMVVDAAVIRLSPRSAPPRSTPRLPSRGPRPLLTSPTPRRAEIATPLATLAIQEVANPADAAIDAPGGGCTQGCVVGAGDPGPGDAEGVGTGAETVVPIVPGGDLRPPLKVRDTPPIYPVLALQSRLEGRVTIECRIDMTGRVVDATVLQGHPLLSPAALVAVRQWVYKPTLLNGVPVSVIMTVTVHFRLRH
jgi:protein TonB